VKKRIYVVLLLFGMSVVAYASPTIAVIDFDSGSWCTTEEAKVMTEKLTVTPLLLPRQAVAP